MGSRDQWEFPPFFRRHSQSVILHSLNVANAHSNKTCFPSAHCRDYDTEIIPFLSGHCNSCGDQVEVPDLQISCKLDIWGITRIAVPAMDARETYPIWLEGHTQFSGSSSGLPFASQQRYLVKMVLWCILKPLRSFNYQGKPVLFWCSLSCFHTYVSGICNSKLTLR